ncbi:hypothetical protein CEXT_288971 [Caerostris extrusa]|uniref:Uncharacterized protein n=1 Tax=Caerostris extrusa TaxID=172846 RepID=A0AAV4XZG4_CAEEX|nr:hypothetical protein CEXT_288971 [Caerostris extrusa]
MPTHDLSGYKRNAGIARGSLQSPLWCRFLRNVVLSVPSKFNQSSTDRSESTETGCKLWTLPHWSKDHWTNGSERSSRGVLTLKSLNEYLQCRNSTLKAH